MKKYLLIIIFIAGASLSGVGQVNIGIKGGLSTYDLGVDDGIDIINGTDEFKLVIEDAKYGYHLGLVLQFITGSFVIQPEIVFNSNSVDYSFIEVSTSPAKIFTEKYQNLDIPFLLGLTAGPLRLMGGPVGHYHLSSSSELLEFENYSQKFQNFTYGWQAGIGFNIFNLMLDVRYEGNFTKFGDHIQFFGDNYTFSNTPSRLLASLAVTIK